VAFAPRENPKIAIAVVVENAGFGATWSAPIASLMVEKYLRDSISRPAVYKERITQASLLPAIKQKLNPKTPVKKDSAKTANKTVSRP
jgi:penicillin-binding protein 2